MNKSKIKAFFIAHKWALLLVALIALERIAVLVQLGPAYSLGSDDLSYIQSGIVWSQTGRISMHDFYPSAQIMPGMTVFIGLFVLIFGQGAGLWLALKLAWIVIGAATAWLTYRAVTLLAPKWCGVLAMACFLRPDFAWMDNLILTETPFLLALTAMVYFTLKMGKKPGWKPFFGCLTAYLAGLLLKANIAPYPLLALIYLLCVGYNKKLLAKQCAAAAAAVLCLIIPWSIRNYMQFDAFVPLTYGAGNPTLLGTYQGNGWPQDEALDYETNVDQVVQKQYARYYQPDGSVKPEFERYVQLQHDMVKAKYRQRVWWKDNPSDFLFSYLLKKPGIMSAEVFYWEPVLGVPSGPIKLLEKLDLLLCAAAAILAFLLKKQRRETVFLLSVYLLNLYIYAIAYAFERYNASLMSVRFMLVGSGIGLAAEAICSRRHRSKS